VDPLRVDLPPLVKLEREGFLAHALELREMFEQRIRRRRGDDCVSRITEQLEKE
jgi:hypothetical protein